MRKNRAYKKGGPFRDATLVVVAGEGDAEYQYFEGINFPSVFFAPIKRDTESGHSAYDHLIEDTVKYLKENKASSLRDFNQELGDQVWIIADLDIGNNKPEKIRKAFERCQDLGYHFGITNPCFEYWLLLHLGSFDPEQSGSFLGRDGGAKCEKQLRDLLGSYNKTNLRIGEFHNIRLACERAKAMDKAAEPWPPTAGSRLHLIFERVNFNMVSIFPDNFGAR